MSVSNLLKKMSQEQECEADECTWRILNTSVQDPTRARCSISALQPRPFGADNVSSPANSIFHTLTPTLSSASQGSAAACGSASDP